MPYVIVVRVWQGSDGRVTVSTGLQETSPGRRYPRTIQKPWNHTFTLREDVSQGTLFQALRKAVKDLSETSSYG